MVSLGVGRLLKLVCVDPHGGPFRAIMGLSHSWMCGCSLVHGVFVSMLPTLFACAV